MSAPSVQKIAEDEKPKVTLLTDKVRRQARAVFVPSPDYERQRRHGLFDQGPRIFVVHGPESAHNFYTAVHLGFEFYSEGKSAPHDIYPSTTPGHNPQADPFVRYAKGIQRLSRAWRNHPQYHDLELYEIQMRTAVDRAVRFGVTPMISEDIYRIIDGLSLFTPPLFPEGHNFADYCDGIKARPINSEAPGKAQIFTLEPASRETRLLIDYVPVKELQGGAVYIVQDAFERGISVGGISREMAAELEDLLTTSKDNASLILTTTLPDYRLDDLPPQIGRVASLAETRGERDIQLERIFREMLRFYRAKDALPDSIYNAVENRITTLIKTGLNQPSRIEAFCAKLVGLLDDSGGLLEDVDYGARVTQLAERVYVEQASVHDYFQSLPPNHKLYALLAELFDNVNRLFLDELYSILVQVLRKQGLPRLRDPRELGRDDLLERALLREKPGVVSLDFTSPAFRNEVRRQTRNYNHLLWSCADHLVGKLKERDLRGPEAQEFRHALGVALGQLGVHHRWKFLNIVDLLAHDPSGAIVAVAAIALAEICRESVQFSQFVLDLLELWAKSDDFDLMWAAGASVWRIYDALDRSSNQSPAANGREQANPTNTTGEQNTTNDQQQFNVREPLCAVLTYLGGRRPNDFKTEARLRAFAQIHELDLEKLDELKRAGPPKFSPLEEALVGQIYKGWTTEVHKCVLVAVDKIALTHVNDVVVLLESWLRSSELQLRLTGLAAVQRLFAPEHYQNTPLLVDRHRPLLSLIRPVLRADVDMPSLLGTMDAILDTLREWAMRPTWAGWIEESLRREIDEADTRQIDLLRTCISARWLDTTTADSAKVRMLGRRLIARINLLDGVPVDLPGSDYGVIALDASHMMVGQAIKAGRRLHERLSAYIDLVVGRMGQEHALLSCGEPLIEERLMPQRGHFYPALLQPLLETLDPTRNSFVLALAWNPIHDLDDLEESLWSSQMIVVLNPAMQEEDWSRHDIMLALDRWTDDPYHLDLIELFLRMRIADQLRTPKGVVFALQQGLSDERSLVVIETLVRVWIARRLALRDKTAWWDQFNASFQLAENASHEEQAQAALTKVEEWIAHGDRDEVEGTTTVSLRDALSTILWLAAADPAHCVRVLKGWLSDERVPARLLGAAGARSIFAVYAEHQSVPPLETYGVLLELAPLLASHGWRSARTMLYAAWRWSIDPAWANRLAAGADGRPSELMALVAALLPAHREHLGALLDAWLDPEFLHPLREQDQLREVPLSLRKLAEQMRLQIALSEHKPHETATTGRRYGLILLDASMPPVNGGRDRDRRQRLAEIVSIIIQQLVTTAQKSDTDIVLYHLGHINPVAAPNAQLAPDQVLPGELGDRPRLAGPLLDLFHPAQIGFVLLVANSPIHDLDDVANGDWPEQFYLYRDIDRSRWSHPLREIVVRSTDMRRLLPDVHRVADAIVETLGAELRGV